MRVLDLNYESLNHRLHEAFGAPRTILNREGHWSLRPSTPYALSIDVLIERGEPLAVWVFDPYLPEDGILRIAIHDEPELEEAIDLIRDRVKCADRGVRGVTSDESHSSCQFLEKLLEDCFRADPPDRELIKRVMKALVESLQLAGSAQNEYRELTPPPPRAGRLVDRQ